MKTLAMAALVAATALVPMGAASAAMQDARGDEHHGNGGGRPAAQPAAPQPQAQAQPQVQARPQSFQPTQAPQQFQQRPAQPQARFQQQPQFQGQPGGQRGQGYFQRRLADGAGAPTQGYDRGGQGQQPAQPYGYRGGQGQQPAQPYAYRGAPGYAPQQSGGGRPYVGGGYAPGQQAQGYRAPAYNQNRFAGAPNGYGYRGGGGGAWDRGWRGDSRFGWTDYRASHYELFRLPRYYAPYGWSYGYQRFAVGVALNEALFAQDYWIDDPYYYRLPEPDGPYRWVRYYNDALLVDIYTGQVVDAVYGIFY